MSAQGKSEIGKAESGNPQLEANVVYQKCWERNWARHIADLKANDREWIREDARLEALLGAMVAIETEMELAALERLAAKEGKR